MRNAPFIHPSQDSILELWRTLPNGTTAEIDTKMSFQASKPELNITVVAQSVTCLTTDARLTADPGVVSYIQARSHSFVVIDHEVISTFILFLLADSFRRVVVSYKQSMCTNYLLTCPGKSVVR